jgi:hypothetical protein
MKRRAARRVVSVGALLGLTVWLGGLPAAVADEPAPDTPAAVVPAVPGVGDEPAADVTSAPEPSPSPSVEPTSPDGQPTPATEPSPTPSPEPSNPGAGTGEEPGPGSEPTPTPSDAPPATGAGEPGAPPSPAPGPPPTDPSRAGLEAAAPVGTVTIGDFDCDSLTVQVALDNSRGSDAVRFSVSVLAAGGLDPRRSARSFELGAGEVRGVKVALQGHAVNTVVVTSDLWPGSMELARGETTCGYVSRAAIDAFDCGSLTATAHLENGSPTVPTVFHVRSATRDETLMDDDVEVPPGATTSISIPLGVDTEDSVSITGPGSWLLAEERAVCGEMVIAPRAVIGDTDCSTLTVPVTLDNSASTVGVTYSVYWRPLASDEHDDSRDEQVGAGEVRHLRLPIEDSAFYLVNVSARDSEPATSPPLARSISTGGCGLLRVGPVDCLALTVDLTIHNTNAHFGGQVFMVHSDRYPQHPSAFHTVVLVAPGATTVVTVPLRELDGGPIVIDQPGDTWFSPVATIPVDEACPPGVTPDTRAGSTAPSDRELLAATGAEGLPQVLLGGLLLLTLGVVLLRAARERHD